MRIHDISIPLHERTVVWPGDPAVELAPLTSLEAGDGAAVSRLGLGTHTGTHVDAPAHVLLGATAVDDIPLRAIVGPAHVIYLPHPTHIGAEDLAALELPHPCRRVLLRTANSDQGLCGRGAFRSDFCALLPSAARWLVARNLCCVGIDAPSVDPFEAKAGPVHRLLLAKGIAVIEGLDLSRITPGCYQLVCLPLKVVGADGAPARAILIEPD